MTLGGFALALLLACIACGPSPSAGGAEPPPGSPPPPPQTQTSSPVSPGPPPGEGPPRMTWQTETPPPGAVPAGAEPCEKDDDCVKVVTTCCDECNGGTAVAVAKTKAASVQKTGCAPDVRCTMRGCFTRVACESGKCVVQRGVAK